MSGTVLLTSWEDQEPEDRDGFRVIKLSAGDPHTQAIYGAVVDRYNDIACRERPTVESLQAFVDQKVTLVQHGENMMGGGILKAEEGKLFLGANDVLGILPKGKRTNGLRVNPNKVLDVLPGYAAASAAEMVREVQAHFPTLKAITQETLSELPPRSDTLSVCFFGTYPMPDTVVSDVLILAGAYSGEEDDIVDDSIILIRPEHGVSEHGSQYGQTLLRGRFGQVVGYQPISFGEGIALCNLSYEDAYERLLGNCVAA